MSQSSESIKSVSDSHSQSLIHSINLTHKSVSQSTGESDRESIILSASRSSSHSANKLVKPISQSVCQLNKKVSQSMKGWGGGGQSVSVSFRESISQAVTQPVS